MARQTAVNTAKYRTLWPLPGGRGKYLKTLDRFLKIAEKSPSAEVFVTEVIRRFQGVSSRKAAMSYLRVTVVLGFVSIFGGQVELTESGGKLLATGNTTLVQEALFNRVAGIKEVYAIVKKDPGRLGIVSQNLQKQGYVWSGLSQIRYRLQWLEEVGLVDKRGGGRPEYFAIGG